MCGSMMLKKDLTLNVQNVQQTFGSTDGAKYSESMDCLSCSSCASESIIFCDETTEGLCSPASSVDEFFCVDGQNLLDVDLIKQQEHHHISCYLARGGAQAATGITAAQRAAVVDNMIQAAAQLDLDNDSLFLGVACLDRFLSVHPTDMHLLQPVSITCLWLAAKYEQCVVPSAANFAQLMIGPDGFSLGTEPQSLQLLVLQEREVLKALDYRLASIVTTKAFKHRIMQLLYSSAAAAQLNPQQLAQLYCMTSYITEASLLEYQLLTCLPSQVAAAAFVLAHLLLDIQLTDTTMLAVTGYTVEEVSTPMQWLCSLHHVLFQALCSGQQPYAVSRKYYSPLLCCVAAVRPVVSRDDERIHHWQPAGVKQQQQQQQLLLTTRQQQLHSF